MRLRLDGEVLQALEALKNASKEIQDATAGGGCNSPSMNALLALQNSSDDLLSGDPHLSTLTHLLSRLKSLSYDRRTRSFLRSLSGDRELARVAGSIGSEIQSWIDRETVDRLVSALNSLSSPSVPPDDFDRAAALQALAERVSRGFDSRLQDVLLRSGAFAAVEAALCDAAASKLVRDRAAAAAAALVRFNKNVFVEPVLMGTTVRSLVSMASPCAILALNGLISAIRSPIVDEILSNGEIPRIVGLLGDVEMRVVALESVMEIAYHGRKEAIDAMVEEGIVERLMELQRSELGGALIEMDGGGGGGGGVEAGEVRRERRWLEERPFASCVARVAIQVEVGEGLRQREKRAFKAEVVRRVRAAADGGAAEAATVLAEVLWGSTP